MKLQINEGLNIYLMTQHRAFFAFNKELPFYYNFCGVRNPRAVKEKLFQAFDYCCFFTLSPYLFHTRFLFGAISKVTIFFTLSNIHLGPSGVSRHRQAV
ncbi:MAG: hypothetical protein BGO77_08125 [Caedibacter sp. 37-49]|nr:MAG: hypothetical protein BGO77_08125 [Caedibacter sp. 37-49]